MAEGRLEEGVMGWKDVCSWGFKAACKQRMRRMLKWSARPCDSPGWWKGGDLGSIGSQWDHVRGTWVLLWPGFLNHSPQLVPPGILGAHLFAMFERGRMFGTIYHKNHLIHWTDWWEGRLLRCFNFAYFEVNVLKHGRSQEIRQMVQWVEMI